MNSQNMNILCDLSMKMFDLYCRRVTCFAEEWLVLQKYDLFCRCVTCVFTCVTSVFTCVTCVSVWHVFQCDLCFSVTCVSVWHVFQCDLCFQMCDMCFSVTCVFRCVTCVFRCVTSLSLSSWKSRLRPSRRSRNVWRTWSVWARGWASGTTTRSSSRPPALLYILTTLLLHSPAGYQHLMYSYCFLSLHEVNFLWTVL